MKKFLISLAVACLLACIAVSAFAAPVNDQWIKKATVDVRAPLLLKPLIWLMSGLR